MRKYLLYLSVLFFTLVFFTLVSAQNVTSLFTKTLQVGSRGAEVKKLEQFLTDEGYYTGRIDGIYGKKIARIVKDFQIDNNLTANGIFDKRTMTFVNKYLSKLGVGNASDTSNTSNNSKGAPVISKISGPQTLDTGKEGTWTVTVTAPNPGPLTYKIDWGDGTKASGNPGARQDTSSVQTGTFSRSFFKAGLYDIVFTATDSFGLSSSTSLTIKVVSSVVANPPPAGSVVFGISTVSLPDGQVGVKYSQDIVSSSAPASTIWSVSGKLPGGLSQNTSGCISREYCITTINISGVPTTAGVYTIYVDLSSGGKYASKKFTLNIKASEVTPTPNTTQVLPTYTTPPIISNPPIPTNTPTTTPTPITFVTSSILPDMQVGTHYDVPISVKGGNGVYLWSVSAGYTLPPGLALISIPCVEIGCKQNVGISGTPKQAGTFNFKLTATSGTQIATQGFSVTIGYLNTSSSPHISSVLPTTAKIGATITIVGTNMAGTDVNFEGYFVQTVSVSDTKIVFTIPSSLNSCFANSSTSCIPQYIPTYPGYASIYLQNTRSGAVSNSLQILVSN